MFTIIITIQQVVRTVLNHAYLGAPSYLDLLLRFSVLLHLNNIFPQGIQQFGISNSKS